MAQKNPFFLKFQKKSLFSLFCVQGCVRTDFGFKINLALNKTSEVNDRSDRFVNTPETLQMIIFQVCPIINRRSPNG